MRYRIVFLCLILALAAALLTGCLQLDIAIGIDEVYNSFLSYTISMDVSDVDPQYHMILEDALNRLGWLYQENLGFSVSMSTDSNIHTLTMRQATGNSSLPEAFDALKAMLTDEGITAFSQAYLDMESFPRRDSYIIGAMLDIPYIVQHSNAEELPPQLQMELEKALKASSGTITLSVPLSEFVSSSHEIEMAYRLATMTVPFDFTEQTEFEIKGSVVYSEDGVQIGTSEERAQELLQTRTVVLIALGSALALLLIILLSVLLRRRKYEFFT